LLRLFCIGPQPDFETPEFLDEALRKQDTSLARRGNAEEMRVLAGAILRNAIETGTASATAISLGLVCTAFGGRLVYANSSGHVLAAEKYLATSPFWGGKVAFFAS